MKTVQKKFLKGFTLIELLIVIAILGILAAAVLVAINPARRTQQARDAQRKNDIGGLATETQAYFTTPGQGLYAAPSSCVATAGGFTVLTALGGLKNIPGDPTAGRTYCYSVNGTTSEASVWATMEEPTSQTTNNDASHLWCWRSATNTATEVATAAGCAP